MTMEDIGNLRLNQFEDLIIGLNENAQELEAEMSGKKKPLEGDDAIKALLS